MPSHRKKKLQFPHKHAKLSPAAEEYLRGLEVGKYVLPKDCVRTYQELEHMIGDKPVAYYQPRNKEFHTEWRNRKHDGQRKLLLSEIEFLMHVVKTHQGAADTPYEVIYAGAAPGTHLKLLIWMFPTLCKWHLVDPVFAGENHRFKFIKHVSGRKQATQLYHYEDNVEVTQEDYLVRMLKDHYHSVHGGNYNVIPEMVVGTHNEIIEKIAVYGTLADNSTMTEIEDKLDEDAQIVLISDIRTPFSNTMSEAEVEKLVQNDMQLQAGWHKLLQPISTMLKFRLPYVAKEVPNIHYEYLAGRLYLPIWGRGATTELRLVIDNANEITDNNFPTTIYDCRKIMNNLYYFNTEIREKVRYEGACELFIIQAYLQTLSDQDPLREILKKVNRVSMGAFSKLISEVLSDIWKQGDQFEKYDTTRHENPARPDGVEEYPPPRRRRSTGEIDPPKKRGKRRNSVSGKAKGLRARAQVASLGAELSKVARRNLLAAMATKWNTFSQTRMAVRLEKGDDPVPALRQLIIDFNAIDAQLGRKDSVVTYPPNRPTPVQAAKYGCKEILQYLLHEFGNNIFTIQDKDGNTVLTVAVFYGQKNVVEWVLETAKEDKGNRAFWKKVLAHQNNSEPKEGVLQALHAGKVMWHSETEGAKRVWSEADLNPYASLKYYTPEKPPPWVEIETKLREALEAFGLSGK